MSLTLHDAAAKKIKQIAEEDPDVKDYHKLRVFIQGGGCSGFQYGFSFDKTVDEDDTCIEKQGANLVIDSLSLQYLQGSTVDYIEDLTGSKFIISNPNATTTCGCGESFSI